MNERVLPPLPHEARHARPAPAWLVGWRLVASATLLVTAAVIATLATHGAEEAGIRAVIRTTATTSLLLFLFTFIAAPLNALFTSRETKWLLANRRYLGVAFAVSQAVHLAFIVVLATSYRWSFWGKLSWTTLLGGGLGYLFIVAMTITSFDGPTRVLGRKAWRVLHTSGVYLLWAIFTFSYLGGGVARPRYAMNVVLLVLALMLRITYAARRSARKRA
jgi:methionine sulfoxide reductase heme-binding subunit